VAIVTGGASGIGAAIARRLHADGAQVAVLDVNPSPGAPNQFAVAADGTDDASVRAAVAAVAERFGRIDMLINNAGIGEQGDVTANSDEEWHRVWNVDVVGPARPRTRSPAPWRTWRARVRARRRAHPSRSTAGTKTSAFPRVGSDPRAGHHARAGSFAPCFRGVTFSIGHCATTSPGAFWTMCPNP